MIVQEWIIRLRRYHPPHEFDTLISKVASDMGRDTIDPVRLRERYYGKWTNDLSQLQGEYEFDFEARRLIEHTLLTETAATMPITGEDVKEVFSISPGPEVGRLLARADALYQSTPCPRASLLQLLMEEERRS